MARTTIADVAQRAGVSKATVSRVLGGTYAYMREETRARVQEAIDEMDYRPSSVARSLTWKRTKTAGVLVSDVGNPFYAEVLHGVEDVAFGGDYDVFLCNTNYDAGRGLAFVRSLIDKQVDGVLLMASIACELWLAELRRSRVPAVVLDWEERAPAAGVGSIGVDFATGIDAAVDHLLALGHGRFAHVSGPLALRTARARRDAFLDALARRGISPASVPVIEGDLQIDGGRRAAAELLRLPERATAVFAANDLTAMGVIAGARAGGLAVPRDLSVVGLDDIWLAGQVDPPLTTVALPRYEIGRFGDGDAF